MKKLFLLLLCSYVAVCAIAQTQQGYAKTKGRMGSNGQVVAGKRLSGVTVQVKGRSAVVTKADGTFSFPIPANKFSIQKVSKQGYVLVDPEATARQYTYSANPLILVLETPSQQTDDKLANERKIRKTLQRQLEAKEDEIEALKAQNKLTEEEYHKQLQQLYAEQENNEKLISDMAERYSQLDYDQMDEFNLRISDCILNGRLTEADSMLRTKGDINTRIAAIQREEVVEAAEAAELAQRQEKLEKSIAGTHAAKEDIAQDCYHYYEAFKMKHQNDSAAHYLELRAALDTTNVQWQYEAGKFIYEYLADYSSAMNYVQLGLRQTLATDGEQSKWATTFYNSIGVVYYRQGDYAQALEFFQKALAIDGRIYGSDHLNMATSYNNIGSVYSDLGDYAQALEYQLKALSIVERVYGSDHPKVATTYNNIGFVYQNQGDYALAMEYYQKALSIWECVNGSDHPDVALSYNNIGNVYSMQGDYTLALEYHQRALSIWERVYGADHPDMATSCNNIGRVCSRQGDYAHALEYYQKALSIRERVYGTDHPNVATCYSNIGYVYYIQGDYDHALEYYQRALSIWERFYGADHPDVATSCNNIGGVYYGQGDYNKSLEFMTKAYNGYLKAFGSDHPNTQQVKEIIDYLKRQLGQ